MNKDIRMIVWLMQLGMSVAVPMAGCVLLALWLRQKFGLGAWVICVGCVVGLVCAIDGFANSMKSMQVIDAADRKKPDTANRSSNKE